MSATSLQHTVQFTQWIQTADISRDNNWHWAGVCMLMWGIRRPDTATYLGRCCTYHVDLQPAGIRRECQGRLPAVYGVHTYLTSDLSADFALAACRCLASVFVSHRRTPYSGPWPLGLVVTAMYRLQQDNVIKTRYGVSKDMIRASLPRVWGTYICTYYSLQHGSRRTSSDPCCQRLKCNKKKGGRWRRENGQLCRYIR